MARVGPELPGGAGRGPGDPGPRRPHDGNANARGTKSNHTHSKAFTPLKFNARSTQLIVVSCILKREQHSIMIQK